MSRSLGRLSFWLLVFFVLLCLGEGVLPDFAFALAFGWIIYLMRVLPEVRINWEGVATAVTCLALFVIGAHIFLGWFYQQVAGGKGPVDRRWRRRWTTWLVGGILLMFVSGLAAAGVAHQVGWLITSPEPIVQGGMSPVVWRAQSTNNLKQIGLGLRNYHDVFGTLPTGGTFDRQGRPLLSWQAMILPYTEQKDLYDRIDLGIPWDDPRNASAFQTTVGFYLYPGIAEQKDSAGYALSHYAGNVRMLGGNVPRSLRSVTDGESNTLMAGEVVGRFKPWGDPTNWRDPTLGINRSAEGFGSRVPGGANLLMVDGSVRFIKDTVDSRVLEALSTPQGGEPVSPDQY
jgi:prepilin-type processing-associated H-X9-DG protein